MTNEEVSYSPETLSILSTARELAEETGAGGIEDVHLLCAIATTKLGIFPRLFRLMKIAVPEFQSDCRALIHRQSTDRSQSVHYAYDHQTVALARAEAKLLGQDLMMSELLLLALLKSELKPGTGEVLSRHEITRERILRGILELTSQQELMTEPQEDIPTDGSSILDKFGRDLTQLAMDQKLDPVIGRDEEVRAVIKTLLRRTKCNPLLLGEPGTGKTAICEDLAARIAAKDVPEPLKKTRLIEIDMGQLAAGASAKGQFEQRVKDVVREVEGSQGTIILMIDEIHTIMAQSGGISAADLLKPAMARGTMRVVGLTTQTEFKLHIEKDKAMTRRFEVIQVEEPSIDMCISMLRGIRDKYELFHGLSVSDNAIQTAVRLSARYVSGRFLPDKAIDVIDRVSSGVKTETLSLPDEIDRLKREVDRYRMELESLKSDSSKESDSTLKKLKQKHKEVAGEFSKQHSQWRQERQLTDKVLSLQARLTEQNGMVKNLTNAGLITEANQTKTNIIPTLESELEMAEEELVQLRESGSWIKSVVGEREVAEEVARQSGIPVDSLISEEISSRYNNIPEIVAKRFVGQHAAVAAVSKALVRMAGGVKDPGKPIGSFLFLGPTGVGKTELAKTLAEFMFGHEKYMIRFDMSEFKDEQLGVSKLIGSAPGYVGYEAGGVLTEAVRNNPYSLICFDEIEKAHPSIHDIFLQLLDDGILRDSKGNVVSFANSLIIMTSNIGAHHFINLTDDNYDEIQGLVLEELTRYLKPELRNRFDDFILFKPLSKEDLYLRLDMETECVRRLLSEKEIQLEDLSDRVKDFLIERGYDPKNGARPLIRVTNQFVRGAIAYGLLGGQIRNQSTIYLRPSDGEGLIAETSKVVTEDDKEQKE